MAVRRIGFESLGMIALVLLATGSVAAQMHVHVEAGSAVTYLANGSDPGIGLTWTLPGFDDAAWSSGTLGIGFETGSGAENLIQTPVASGSSSIYARTTFEVANLAGALNVFLGADYDDGYVAWINGIEVYRSPEMPAGTPLWDTSAALHESSNGAQPDYGTLIDVTTAALAALQQGTNVLAVGVWNNSAGSSDLVVVPRLVENVPPTQVTRGPYVQLATDSSVIVRWRTAGAIDSRVDFGAAPDSLTQSVTDGAVGTDHEVALDNLADDTTYYYAIGSTGQLFIGGDADHFFRTAPFAGTRRPMRVWAIGDSGTANADARAVRDAYASFTGATYTDVWLMLGDNAYVNGEEAEYQAAVFDTYPELLRSIAVWPTLGNHDGISSSSADESGPYYDAFTLPAQAEAGGVISGTEAYYSFDYGNVHFVCLNSHDVDRDPAADMMTWLLADLGDTAQDWIVAYWHHPPYTKGSHDSDLPGESGGRMTDMRRDFLPVLEDWGVDLVLSGHSHSYERSFLLDGHYETSELLDGSMVLDGGDGRIGGDGAYEKSTQGPAGNEGAVYVVAGSSGKISDLNLGDPGVLDHPAMYTSLQVLGSLVLDIDGDRLDAAFLDAAGNVLDSFTLAKNAGEVPTAGFAADPVAGAAPLVVQFTDQSTTNATSWSWDFDGNGSPDSSERDDAYTYTIPGQYTVSLEVSNGAGADQKIQQELICVSAGPPVEINQVAWLDASTLAWGPIPGAQRYDVMRGSLLGLLGTDGDFAGSADACVADDLDGLTVGDGTIPAVAQAFYYLIRGVSCADEPGSYDSDGPGQGPSRDAGLLALPCL